MEKMCQSNSNQIMSNKEENVKYVNELYQEVKNNIYEFESQFDRVKDIVQECSDEVQTNKAKVD